ncbi:MAG TPA: ABC transporter permease [Acidimicrobiia bacterium]|nr:ABC transporter permease [bacterium AH-315-A03]MCH2349401.1 ABC transporter permease [Candidatus Poseidoniales archaeon]MCH2515915.1 ABC transporter permease [Dehalococcoidia bacterium]RUA05174.1 MAG: ABC transporter permease [Candidatus Poseidoniales archaeon]HIM86151.1 ABC transporter permease [Acidimicrobiia bacterium]
MTGEGIADPGELPPARFVVDRVHVTEEKSRTRRALSFMRSNPLFSIGLGLLIAFVGMAIIGPFLVGDPLLTNPAGMFSPPSADHWFGTDEYGRDVFARSVNAARLDLSIGLAIALVAMTIGSTIGVVSGYFGGRTDEIIMRLTDILLAFPGFVLALIIVAALAESLLNVVMAVAAAYVPYFIRLTRAQALVEREKEYVDAARLAGNRPLRVAFRHVMPNSLGPALVSATLVTGWAVLTVAGLAFLSVGIQPPTAEWGVMVGEGAGDIITGEWWTSLFPGGMIVLAVMAFHFIGDDLTESRT